MPRDGSEATPPPVINIAAPKALSHATMSDAHDDRDLVNPATNEVSLVAVGIALLRWRRTILLLGLVGGLLGLGSALLSRRQYVASATFLPQQSESSVSGLAAAASQFGIQVGSANNGSWGPPLYVKLLGSPVLLESIARDTIPVAELGGRRVPVMDLLEVEAPTPALRLDKTVRTLQRMVSAGEIKTLGVVQVSVVSRWPSVSVAMTQMLLTQVNRFNVERRQSQAAAERRFVDSLATNAERALRDAENRLQYFLQQNRVFASPQLTFERDRLQREVSLRQELYTSLLHNREDARIREVRATPVITVVEEPRLPVVPLARKAVLTALLGGLVGLTIGVLTALAMQWYARARYRPSPEAQELLQLVHEATPRMFRGRKR